MNVKRRLLCKSFDLSRSMLRNCIRFSPQDSVSQRCNRLLHLRYGCIDYVQTKRHQSQADESAAVDLPLAARSVRLVAISADW